MEFKLLKSSFNDPAINLAIEEYLTEGQDNVIYLWINKPTIVIGRNQNPYMECNVKKINDDKVYLMRRRSGGGAVYHDLGNLNFTIISDKALDTIDNNFNLIIKILKSFNIEARVSGRNDLEVDGRKISGSAFYENEHKYLHHATLLVDVDMSKLESYLKPSPLKLRAKGIESVKARVINLKELNKDITTAGIIKGFEDTLGMKAIELDSNYIRNGEIQKRIATYRSFSWVYGEAMDYDIKLTNKFSWGLIDIDLKISDATIKEARIYTDSIIIDVFKELEEALMGTSFKKSSIEALANDIIKNDEIKRDIISLFDIS